MVPIRPKAIEGWSNTTARLAVWMRVAQQGVILYDVRDGRSMLALTDNTARPGLGLLSCERLAIPAAAAAGLLLIVHNQLT